MLKIISAAAEEKKKSCAREVRNYGRWNWRAQGGNAVCWTHLMQLCSRFVSAAAMFYSVSILSKKHGNLGYIWCVYEQLSICAHSFSLPCPARIAANFNPDDSRMGLTRREINKVDVLQSWLGVIIISHILVIQPPPPPPSLSLSPSLSIQSGHHQSQCTFGTEALSFSDAGRYSCTQEANNLRIL